jgi:hypothetical protein
VALSFHGLLNDLCHFGVARDFQFVGKAASMSAIRNVQHYSPVADLMRQPFSFHDLGAHYKRQQTWTDRIVRTVSITQDDLMKP